MRPKTGGMLDMVHSFYEIQPETLDVLVLGSSHAYYSFQPNVLWGEQGYTSYVMGTPQQSAATSYFLLKEALKYQKPKVVLFEGYYMSYDGAFVKEARLRTAFDAIPDDEVKTEALNTLLPDLSWKEKLNWYIPFCIYHNRGQSLSPSDFQSRAYLRGGKLDRGVIENVDYGLDVKEETIPEVNTEYFEKILALCRENGIELITYVAPYGGDDFNQYYKRRLGIVLSEKKYMKKLGVPFLSYLKAETVDIDFSTDFRDTMHLNLNGQRKITCAIGEYLKENLNLEDHRGDEKYDSWEEGYQMFLADVHNGRVSENEGNG